MERQEAIDLIRSHSAELRQLGILRLSLFGSTARGDAIDGSDVDIAVYLEEIAGGLAYFDRLDEIERRLSDILGKSVDVLVEPVRREQIQQAIDRDRHVVF